MDGNVPDPSALPDKLRHILRIMKDKSVASTKDLTAATGYPNATIYHHSRRMLSEGWIENAGTVDVGAPQPANVYRITDAGREIPTQIDGREDDAGDGSSEDLSEAHARIDELEHEIATLEKQNDRTWTRLKETEAEVDEMKTVIEKIGNRVREL